MAESIEVRVSGASGGRIGIPPLLAMAAGTACVRSDAATLPEVVGDAALLFHAGDPASLAERLRVAAEDPASLRELAARGKERAARFSVEALAERMTRVYERAVSRPGESG